MESKREAISTLTDIALNLSSDEAYKKMFIESADLYVLEEPSQRDNEGRITDENNGAKSIPKYRKLTDKEKQNLKVGRDGKITIFNNGIFTSADSAAQYADQHNPNAQYFLYFPETNNVVSELMVAGYMKFMENDFWGLSNATQETKNLMQKYGTDGIHFDAHSRGAMTTGNALKSLNKDQTQIGRLKRLTVNFVGPAFNADKADVLLSNVQGRSNMTKEQQQAAKLYYQAHKDDAVATLIGGNKPTGGNSSKGKNTLQEWWGMKGDATVHSCYGGGNPICARKDYWKGSIKWSSRVETS